MRRSTFRTGVAWSVAAVALLVPTGCGADQERTRESGAAPSSSASPSSPADERVSDEAEAPGEGADNPINSADVAVVAQTFVEHALSSTDLLNARTIEEAVRQMSVYFTDQVATDLIALAGRDEMQSFRALPWKMPSIAEYHDATFARGEVVSMTQTEATPTHTDITVVADFRWEFGPDGWNTGTRTYHLRMIPADDGAGMRWRASGIAASDSNMENG